MSYKVISILVTTFALSIAHAEPNHEQLKALYTQFQTQKEDFLKSQMTKAEFTKKLKVLKQNLDKTYQAYRNKEGDALTEDGNQLALELELLNPLEELAKSKMTGADCQRSLHNNDINASPDDMKTSNMIKDLINQICR